MRVVENPNCVRGHPNCIVHPHIATIQQENKMGIETRARILQADIERKEAELSRLLSLPEDTFDEGAVLCFEKQFALPDGRKYSYMFQKAGGAWYSSGPRRPGPYRWEELLDFLNEGVTKVWEVQTWIDITEELLD